MEQYRFISTKYSNSSKLALLAFLVSFAVILLGAYTRLTDAGLSCPDWPHCYGYLHAPFTTQQLQSAEQKFPQSPINVEKAWTEMTHRYAAATTGIIIIIFAFSILMSRKARDLKAKLIGLGLIGLLSLQVFLGKLTVTEQLKPIIVLSHLIVGLSILSILWWAYLDLQTRHDFLSKKTSLKFIPWLWGALFLIFAQISLGGWVSSHYAGLACVDFPYCNGNILPNLNFKQLNTDLVTIHMLHRIGACISLTYLSVIALALLKDQSLRSQALLFFALISLQTTLGVLNIIWLRPIWVALMHHAFAIILLLSIITALVKTYSATREYRHGFWFA